MSCNLVPYTRDFLLFKCDPLTCRLWRRMWIGPITRLCQRRYSFSCGAVLTNLISLFKWICAPCSQRILRHRCVIVWILSQDNYASFCRNENKARKSKFVLIGSGGFYLNLTVLIKNQRAKALHTALCFYWVWQRLSVNNSIYHIYLTVASGKFKQTKPNLHGVK